jgi:hypothetical protein
VNKAAAAQYLTDLFGTRQGFVAVAHKVPGDKGNWKEAQFEWPRGKNALLQWAADHTTDNVFICPALRIDPHVRKKGDMRPTSWLWADVDWQTIPAENRAGVKRKIAEVASKTVRSGSGENVHVYVKLTRDVDRDEFAKLNTGLRDYLLADTKQADNSFLRLPGTTNWKTEGGSPVKAIGSGGEVWEPSALLKKPVFRNAKVAVDAEASDWDFVEVEGMSRRMMSRVQMTLEEAYGIYHKRHKAVWAITKELHRKWGLDNDQIHSLMHTFPPALSKAAEENGYDVHTDIDRCLSAIRATEGLTREEAEEVEGDALELATDADDHDEYEADVERLVAAKLKNREAERRARQQEAMAGHTEPPSDTSTCLSDALSVPPEPVQWLINGLCSAEANVVIAGQYKSGKTKLMLASLIKALVDDEQFLGAYDVQVPNGGAIVGHWNLEMSALDVIDKYMRPVGYTNTHNVHIANWRGYRLNILTEPGKDAAVEWLKSRNVQVWTLDSWTALCRMCGVDPNSGVEASSLIGAIDEIKQRAGVPVFFFLAHIARASADSERPGTRGASEVDDHVDTRWMFTVDKSEIRYLAVQGRDTEMSPTSLEFNEKTGMSKAGTTRQTAAAFGGTQMVVSALQSMNGKGLNKTALVKKLKEIQGGLSSRKADEYIEEALTADFIELREEHGRAGVSKVHYLTSDSAPEDDRQRKATPGLVDLSSVRQPNGRRRG